MIAPHDPLRVWLASAAPTASESAVAPCGALHVNGFGAAGLRVETRLTVPDRVFGRVAVGFESFIDPCCCANARAVVAGTPASAASSAIDGQRKKRDGEIASRAEQAKRRLRHERRRGNIGTGLDLEEDSFS